MSTTETPAKPAPAETGRVRAGGRPAEGKREKRTITEIRESKQTGEKMVYMSVPDYTSAQWAEMAGVDVAVVGDSLAMIAHGHRKYGAGDHGHDDPACAGRAARRAEHLRARLHAVPELQHGRPRARQRHALHAGGARAMRSSRRAANRRPIFCARWSMPAFRPRRISASRRTRSPCSAASRFRAAPRMRP